MLTRRDFYNTLFANMMRNSSHTPNKGFKQRLTGEIDGLKQRQIFAYLPLILELLSGFEPLTSPLPRVCSTN